MSDQDEDASRLEHRGSFPADNVLEGDEAELARMGYKQELKSVWTASTHEQFSYTLLAVTWGFCRYSLALNRSRLSTLNDTIITFSRTLACVTFGKFVSGGGLYGMR